MSEFEHATQTPWGYTMDADKLPDFITATEFNAFTANKFAGDTRIEAGIPAASSAIRNYCGWHIAPNLVCGTIYSVRDLRDSFVGPDLLIQLPATFVTSVEKIILGAKWNNDTQEWDGDVITDPDRFDIGTGNGLLRVYDIGYQDRKSKIFIKYTAGYPETFPLGSLKELTANRVTHGVANSYGVASEAAGGVSVSYSTSWTGLGTAALSEDAKEVLESFKVKGVY